MVAPQVDIEAIGALIIEVSERVIVPRFRALADADVAEKAPGDLVTVADTEAEALITAALLRTFPDVPVIGEEAVAADPRLVEDLDELASYWLLDPLDGTANFVAGDPGFGTMLALVHDGQPVASWLWLPVRDLMVTAEKGGGAWSGGRRLATGPGTGEWTTAASRAWVPKITNCGRGSALEGRRASLKVDLEPWGEVGKAGTRVDRVPIPF